MTGPEMAELCPQPLADQPYDAAALSESGRTYTVSENSEELLAGMENSTSGGRMSAGSLGVLQPRCKDDSDGPLSQSLLDRRLLLTGIDDGPSSLGSLPGCKPHRLEGKRESLPTDLKERRRLFALEFKERSLSFEHKKKSSSESLKLRSTSLDYKKFRNRSSSEIANNYLPDSLKNFISLENAAEEDFKQSSGGNDSDDESESSSSSEDELPTTVFCLTSPAGHRGSPLSPPVIHEPTCQLASPHASSTAKRNVSPPVKKTPFMPNSPSVSKSMSSSHIHNGGTGSSCPVHGIKSRHFDSAASSPLRKNVMLSSLSSSANASRNSLAENPLLQCGICTKRYKHPKMLPCLHTFCEQCLVDYSPAESLTITCPICRQQSILPKEGVAGLQSNWSVCGMHEMYGTSLEGGPCSNCGFKSSMSCVQCDVLLCAKCADHHRLDSGSDCHSVVSLDDTSSHLSSSEQFAADESTPVYCPSHAGQTLRFYCRNCETAVCSSCTDIEHRNHTTMRLNDAADDQKTGLQRLIDKVTVQLPCMKESLCDLTDVGAQLDVNKKKSEHEVRTCFQGLHDLLDQRQTELMNSLNSYVTIKKDAIETQRDELDKWVSGVEDCCDYVEKSLSELPPMEVVLMKKQLREKLLTYVEVEFPPIPRDNAHIQFVGGNIDALKTEFKHVGNIQTNSAVPQQATAVGEALKKVFVGRQSIVTIVTRDHKGATIKRGGAEIKAAVNKVTIIKNGHHPTTNGDTKVSPESTRSNSRTESYDIEVLDLNNGNYEVFFTVQSIGTYSLSLLLYGQHICSSPFTIEASMPTEDAKSEGKSSSNRGISYLKRQTSKSTQASRKTSSGSNPVPPSQKSSCSRKTVKEPLEDDLILKVGRRGRNKGEFVNPQGICYSTVKDGRIVVADSNNQCVQVFNLSGECKVKFGVRGRSVGQLQRPTGVAALLNGHYAVADYENRWVSVFEPSGKYVNRIGHGKLLGPKGMCVNRHGHLIVVDNKACSIFIFHPSGKLITKFGNRILEGYNFAGPHFCSVNSKGDIIITDFHNHCVRVFTCDGVAKFTFGTNGEGNGQFNAPTGIAVDANDNIIVADWGNSRIQVFDSQGSFLSFVNTLGDPLYGPQGLTLTAEGNIVVADSGNHCFKVYKYLQ